MTAGINPISISRGEIKATRVQVDNVPSGGISGWPFKLYLYRSQTDTTAIAAKVAGFSVVASDTVEIQWAQTDTIGLAPGTYHYVFAGINNLVLSEGPFVVLPGVPSDIAGGIDGTVNFGTLTFVAGSAFAITFVSNIGPTTTTGWSLSFTMEGPISVSGATIQNDSNGTITVTVPGTSTSGHPGTYLTRLWHDDAIISQGDVILTS